MEPRGFTATAWNNGSHRPSGAGYGVKVSVADRDAHFKRQWRTVELHVPDADRPFRVNIDKGSFWNDTCRELISKEIGIWLRNSRLAPWPKGAPPKLRLCPRGVGVFEVRPAGDSF